MYHLPYVSTLNENKILIGLSNIHSRFAHISIMQYLSAINNNYLFLNNGISIPLASVVSFFYIYFFFDAWSIIKNNKNLDISKIFSLFVLIYIAFKITRYSSFGNDAVAHLSYFYLISCVLKDNLKKINNNKILLISVFIFINKPMLGVVFLLPLVIFLIQNKINFPKILEQAFSLPILFLGLWLIKNILISGCIIFPIKSLCIEKLLWTNIHQVEVSQTEGEAWSKAWPDRLNKKISMKEFNKDFNWVKAWKVKHMKYMLNILIPYIVILICIVIFFNIKKKKFKVFYNKDEDLKKRIWLVISTSLIGTLSFFLIFPIYRYGYSYIITLISLLLIMTLKISKKKNLDISVIKFFLILSIIAFISKQSQKIILNKKENLWPNIYTFNTSEKNKINTNQKIFIEDDFYYFYADKGDKLCMYSKSPCTSYIIDKNINHIKKFSYSIFFIK